MTNIATIHTPEQQLDAIVADIAERASKTIENVWHIGDKLNQAKALFGDDQTFGQWRREHITEQLGIADRTQRNFMRIARSWKLDELPRFLGITALTDVASLPEAQQRVALDYFEEAAADGKRIPVSNATSVVQRVRQGADLPELRHRMAPAVLPGVVDVEPIARPERDRPAAPEAEAPVVVDQNGNIEVDVPAPVRNVQRDTPEAWAKTVVQRIRRENGHRRDYLAALKAELTAAGMFEVVEGSASVIDQGRKARIVIGS